MNATHTILDSAGYPVVRGLELDAARTRARLLANRRAERLQIVPDGRDIYSTSEGEIVMPEDRGVLAERERCDCKHCRLGVAHGAPV